MSSAAGPAREMPVIHRIFRSQFDEVRALVREVPAVDTVEAVLEQAGMSLANVVRLNMYTADVDAFMGGLESVGPRMAAGGLAQCGTLLGVQRLAYPELMVELEATAVA